MTTERDSAGGASRRLAEDAWRAVLQACQDAGQRYGYETSVVVIDLDEPVADSDPVIEAVIRATRSCDLIGRLGRTRLAMLALGCPSASVGAIAARLHRELTRIGVQASLSTGSATATPSTPTAPLPSPVLPGVERYVRCGNCGQRGAYVSRRHPVVRCKYCSAKRLLAPSELADAAARVEELAESLSGRAAARLDDLTIVAYRPR